MTKKNIQQQQFQQQHQDDVRQANEEGDPKEQGRTRGVPTDGYGNKDKAKSGDLEAPESGRHDAVE